jgi:hypothetical protein
MNLAMRVLASLLLGGGLAAMSTTEATGQYALLHSLFDPGTNAQAYVQQGYSVAVDGNIAVVGAPYDDVGRHNIGVAKVYEVNTGALRHTLINPSPAEDDYFGTSVAISGTRVVVGAPDDDSGASGAGTAYVYDLAGTMPTVPVLTLTNPSPAMGDRFGFSVAISGTRVVVGAYWDDTVEFFAGSAYVYDLAGTMPTVPMLTLTNPSPSRDDEFGRSVAISGTQVVVGAYRDDTGAPMRVVKRGVVLPPGFFV